MPQRAIVAELLVLPEINPIRNQRSKLIAIKLSAMDMHFVYWQGILGINPIKVLTLRLTALMYDTNELSKCKTYLCYFSSALFCCHVLSDHVRLNSKRRTCRIRRCHALLWQRS